MHFEYKGREFTIQGVTENDSIASAIRKSGCFYEIELLEYMLKVPGLAEPNSGIAIDVGANIGNHSVFIQSFLTKHILSIEPNPGVINTLRHNLSENITNYTIFDVALGETEGAGTIEYPPNSANNIGMAQISKDAGSSPVKIQTLDSIYNSYSGNQKISDPVRLIKIDVEGMELEVLKGSVNVIRAHHPHLFIETCGKSAFRAVRRFLKPFRYHPIRRLAHTPVIHFSPNPTTIDLLKAPLYLRFNRFAFKNAMGTLKRSWKSLALHDDTK